MCEGVSVVGVCEGVSVVGVCGHVGHGFTYKGSEKLRERRREPGIFSHVSSAKRRKGVERP